MFTVFKMNSRVEMYDSVFVKHNYTNRSGVHKSKWAHTNVWINSQIHYASSFSRLAHSHFTSTIINAILKYFTLHCETMRGFQMFVCVCVYMFMTLIRVIAILLLVFNKTHEQTFYPSLWPLIRWMVGFYLVDSLFLLFFF